MVIRNSFPGFAFALLVAGSIWSEPVSKAAASPAAVQTPDAPLTPAEIAAKRLHRSASPPLEHLAFSARQGFSLTMNSSEQVRAEIRNGAGRSLARATYTLEAGDWKLHPRNLPPGVYTVMLWTGEQLRAMRMKIEDPDRGTGSPEWILEKVPADSSQVPETHGRLAPAPGSVCPI